MKCSKILIYFEMEEQRWSLVGNFSKWHWVELRQNSTQGKSIFCLENWVQLSSISKISNPQDQKGSSTRSRPNPTRILLRLWTQPAIYLFENMIIANFCLHPDFNLVWPSFPSQITFSEVLIRGVVIKRWRTQLKLKKFQWQRLLRIPINKLLIFVLSDRNGRCLVFSNEEDGILS